MIAAMNYRHAFHAGNFADCVKHTILVWLLRALTPEEQGLVVGLARRGVNKVLAKVGQ